MPATTLSPRSAARGDLAGSADDDADLFLGRHMAAIVFADIASSTSLLVEMTDRAWCGVLAALDEQMVGIVTRLGGEISNRMGDGYLIVFDGVSRAVRCGELARAAARGLGLDLRVGVHAGEIERHGPEVAGVAVHTAARVQTVAEPGEIVVTEPVMTMSFGSGIEFVPRGEQELRGLPGRWRLWSRADRI